MDIRLSKVYERSQGIFQRYWQNDLIYHDCNGVMSIIMTSVDTKMILIHVWYHLEHAGS